MMEAGSSPEEYIRQVLDGYRNTPGTRARSVGRTGCWLRNCINAASR